MSYVTMPDFDPGAVLDDAFVAAQGLAGRTYGIVNRDPTDPRSNRDSSVRMARLVKNASGGTLTAGQVLRRVTTNTTTMREQVTTVSAGELATGVVCDAISSSGVAANKWFLCVFRGENLVESDGSFSVNDVLKTASTGQAATSASLDRSDFALAIEAATGAAQTKLAFIDARY